MKSTLLCIAAFAGLAVSASAQSTFTAGNIVVLQTANTLSKEGSAATLKEFSTNGTPGLSVAIPTTGTTPFQTAGVFGGSEGFLTTSTNGKYLVLAGYGTGAAYTDITATASSSVKRVIGTVAPSGFYLEVDTSTVFFSANDIRAAVADSNNYWAGGASNASVDGIDYFGTGAPAALGTTATSPKAYALRIFNGNLYYSTQKAGPANTSAQLGIFQVGTGLPTGGTVTTTQIINTGATIPQDFSFNAAGTICYIAVSLNTASGGIQKWTKTGGVWTLAYTLGTGIANTGAYGLVADYSGAAPVIHATTFDLAGNRVIKIVDNGTLASATITTLVAATSNTFYKGIAFAPVASGTPVANLTVSTDTASENGASKIIVKANLSFPSSTAQTVNIGVSGTSITAGDYTLSSTIITIPAGATVGVDTFTVVDDVLVEGAETAVITMSAPSAGITLGNATVKNILITDNDAPGPPAISINTATTTNYLDGGVANPPASPFKISGAINDPTDPAATLAIDFNVGTTQALGVLTLTATSSNQSVVPTANIVISGTGAARNVKITPVGIGYSNITIKVADGFDSTAYVINYAASAASLSPAATRWHTGMSDASDAIALDDNYYVSGDDELNVLNVYSRTASGLPLVSYNYTSNLALPDPAKPEVDVEAATRSFVNAGRVYWMGSMSNGKAPFDNKPNRDRIFATNVSGTGATTSFLFGGYAALRSAVLAWGDANGYSFTASAAAGVDSKQVNGFALEGLVFGPDSTTLYLAFRAPLVPTANRTKAVIAPIKNFESWFNNGAPSGSPVFGSPIEMSLGGRGFRDMTRLSNGTYIIIAGDPGGTSTTGAIYKWTGKPADAPTLVPSVASDSLNMEGVMQVNSGGAISLSQLQVITDKGGDVLYNDGMAAKDFGDLQLRKFRSDVLGGLDLSQPTAVINLNNSVAGAQMLIYPNASEGRVNIRFQSDAAQTYELSVCDINGKVCYHKEGTAQAGSNQLYADLSAFAKGFYTIQLNASSFSDRQKLILK